MARSAAAWHIAENNMDQLEKQPKTVEERRKCWRQCIVREEEEGRWKKVEKKVQKEKPKEEDEERKQKPRSDKTFLKSFLMRQRWFLCQGPGASREAAHNESRPTASCREAHKTFVVWIGCASRYTIALTRGTLAIYTSIQICCERWHWAQCLSYGAKCKWHNINLSWTMEQS